MSKGHFPLASLKQDGWSNEKEATATCFCGEVQMVFPLEKPGYAGSFVCNCTDCHKITASMFASNFTVKEDHTKYTRGQEKLTKFSQNTTIVNGETMSNYFCSVCGTLMYRIGSAFPGLLIMRIGTVDDFTLHETKLKPDIEQYTKDRVAWLHGAEGVKQIEGSNFTQEQRKSKV